METSSRGACKESLSQEFRFVYILLLYVPAQITGVYKYRREINTTTATEETLNPCKGECFPGKGFLWGLSFSKWGLVSFQNQNSLLVKSQNDNTSPEGGKVLKNVSLKKCNRVYIYTPVICAGTNNRNIYI